jgi:hypothetical protein
MATEYQRELARKKARKKGKKLPGDKPKGIKKELTAREQEQIDIDQYTARYQKGKKDKPKPVKPLSTLDDYGKKDSTAISGGSKAVRKIDPKYTGKTTPARTGNELVDKARRKPYKYLGYER